MTGRRSQAQIIVMFKKWIIPHSRAETAMKAMEQLREQKRILGFGFEARAGHLLAPSQSGKTHAVYHNYLHSYLIPEFRRTGVFAPEVSDEAIIRLQKKVIYVKIKSEYLGAFASALLKATGDPLPARGSVDDRIEKAEEQMHALQTELLVLDSFDNLSKREDAKAVREASRTQATIRLMLERGMPMLFVGVPSARTSILNEEQLAHRSDEIEFPRLEDPEDIEEFQEYLEALDVLLAENGVFDDRCDLTDFTQHLFLACRGRYGVLSNLIRDAAIIASKAKSPRVVADHLSQAVDDYISKMPRLSSVPEDDFIGFNPFKRKKEARSERVA